jgi:3-hydroxybutyryl-CoA dehydrogenase
MQYCKPDPVGIVGTGLMGRGIAQIAAQAGCRVLLHDTRAGAAEEARESVRRALAGLAQKGKLAAGEVEQTVSRLQVAGDLQELAACRLVVEAIVEDLEAKRALFRELEGIVAEDCLLATNTSSLSVTAIAAGCRIPARVAGFHFFSPVPLMKLVEVIDGVATAPWVGETLCGFARDMGHTPVRAQDTPGFIVNHAGRGYGTEALRILGEGIAEVSAIDRILRQAAGFRMGPFELLDLTGLDVSHPVMESIYDQYYQEPRFRPSPITRQRLAAGLLGRKTGRGFYEYPGGRQQVAPEPAVPGTRPERVWVSRTNPPGQAAVCALVRELGGTLEDGARPSPEALCVVLPVGHDATSCAVAEGLDAARTVAIDPLFLAGRRTLMTTPVTTTATREAAHGLFSADGIPVSVIHDSPGFVAQRVSAMIVNVGCDIAQQRIATPSDIDRAVTLGLGYPKGPLAMGDGIGPETVLSILRALHDFYGDPRYRPSPWLARRARLGVSLLTPEG